MVLDDRRVERAGLTDGSGRVGGHIVLRIGRPFRVGGEGSGRGRDVKTAATRRVMGAIATLLPNRQRGYYAADVEMDARS